MNRLLWMGCLSYLLTGLSHVIIGSLLPELLAHYSINYSKGGQLVFAQFSGFLVGVLLVPWMSAKFGKQNSLLLALISLGAAEIAYGFLPPWQFMYVIACFAGLGFGAIETIIGTLIIENIKEKKAIAMSRLEVFFGIGALIMPLVVSWMIGIGWWQISFFLLGGLALVIAFVWKVLPLGVADQHMSRKLPDASGSSKLISFTKRERYILALFILFFLIYVGSEMSLVNFLPSFLIVNLKLDTAVASLSVTFFWITMVIGRLFTGVIAEKIKYAPFLLWSCLGSVIFIAMFRIVFHVWSAFAIIMLAGLLMSGIFSIALLFANQLLPGKTERTTSTLIASGGIGGALMPLLIGLIMDHFTVAYAVNFIIGIMFVLFMISLIAFRLYRSLRH
ncbi:MAG: fucose permease [Bacilli bacterium]|nr:fucose permease [Bacilli bacterium]